MDSQATIRAPRGGQGLDQKELTAMPRWFIRNENWDFGGKPDPTEDGTREPKSRKRRLATTFVFTVLFFAGASLAAVAGDRLTASIPSDDAAAILADTTTTDAAPDAAAPAADASAPATDDSAAAAATAAAASHLKSAARNAGVNWAPMLGILRARGASGHSPADRVTLNRLATRLDSVGPVKGDWARIVAYSGDTRFADKATALARFDRAVGMDALVNGLEAAKPEIATRILSDPMVSIYEGGRNDIVADKVDVRVLATIAYLRETFGEVTVSCLVSGHRL